MALTDLIAGLAFVSGHIGLARLDRGLRDGIAIPTEELQAHVTLLSRSAQIITVTNQIQQLKKQADSARKQQLNAQHAQLMVQVGQLQMQLQQLNTERQRLELEEKKELRLAQENRVMRMFVDLYEQAQTYRLQGQVLDFLVVVLAAFRLYRQIYNDLDDANNRLKLSDLRERLFNTVSELLRDGASREKLAEAYARSLQQPLSVLASGQRAQAQAVSLLNTEHGKAEASSASWGQAASSAALGADQLQQARQALEAARRELGQLLGAHDLGEFFFPLQPEQSGGLLVGLSSEWQAWVSAIETHSGQRLADVYKALDQLPGQLDQTLKQAETAVGHSQQNQLTYQLAEALSGLAAVVPGQRAHYQELATQYKSLPIVPGTVNPAALLDNLYELQQIQANVIDGFSPLQRYLDQNRPGADQRYQAETTRRLQALSGTATSGLTGLLPQISGLYSEIGKLNQAISGSIVAHWRQVQRAVATNDGFTQLRARAVQLADEAQIAEVDRLASAQPAGLTNRLLASVKTQTQKLADQHVRWVEHYMKVRPPAAGNISDASRFSAVLPLPLIMNGLAGKPVPPLTPAVLPGKNKTWAWLALAAVVLVFCLFACLLSPLIMAPAAALPAGTSATLPATWIALTSTTSPFLTTTTTGESGLTATAMAAMTASATSEPTSSATATFTPTATPTNTLDPSITPPTATLTPKPSKTPTVTRTATKTRTPTKTAPAPTETSSPTSRPSTPTTVALDNVIVDTSSIIDASLSSVEKRLGNPTEIVAMGIGDVEEIPDGGESRTYQVGKYTLYVNFDKQKIAKGLQVVDGLKADGYTLDQWPLVLERIGVGFVGQPDVVAPAARNWTNTHGYAIMIVADSIGGTVWSVRIYRIPS